MWLFWIGAGALAAVAAGLIVLRAVRAGAAVEAASEDPGLAVYRRQLAELDDLAARGLLAEAERRAAYAEAGRRLLGAAERHAPAERGGGRTSQLILLVGLGAAILGTLALYLALGSPGSPDQPYRARVATWRANPRGVGAAEMAAVLRDIVKQRPNDPQAEEFLGRAQLQAGDPVAAAQAFRKAAALAPGRADLQVMLGEALAAAAEDQPSPEADAAFRKALEIEPQNVPARYFLARSQVLRGDRAAGLAAWKALEAELPADDPRRQVLEQDMARAGQGNAGPAAGGVPAGGPEQAAFIRGMVDRLAARLKQSPDDPDGWARLVRAYRVLGDKAAETGALERARKLFAGRPSDLARIEAEAGPR